MPFYEHMFVARQDVTQQQVEALGQQLADVVKERGGNVTKQEYWGVRSLAYRIKKNRKGHFMLLNVDGPAPAVHEIERLQRLNEDILRFLTVKVEELEEGPSAGLRQAKDREARRGERRFDDGVPEETGAPA